MTYWNRYLILLSLATGLAYGQQAQITGQVTDASGAAVPGAVITVSNNTTGISRTASSNDQGLFVIPLLQPGAYTLTSLKDGFRPVTQRDLSLRVDDRVRIDLKLELGAQAQTVDVTAQTPLLRVDDAQTGLVIDNKRIQELPQYNRNPLAFAQLAPNVNGTADQQGYSSDFRINGGRTAKAEYIIDGVAVTTGFRHDVPPSIP